MHYPAPDPLPTQNPVCSGHWHNIYKKPDHTCCEITCGKSSVISSTLPAQPFSLENHKTSHVKSGRHYLARASLCISCILTKSLKILLAFSFEPTLQNFPKCLHKPIPIIFTCTGIRVVIRTLWLIVAAPAVEENVSLPGDIILRCEQGSILAFLTVLGYIAILAFICFVFAFKGRKLPGNYNEAKSTNIWHAHLFHSLDHIHPRLCYPIW